MKVKELLERSLYLSIKDRFFNALPTDETKKTAILTPFLQDFNQVLTGIGKKNPAFSHLKFSSSDFKTDPDLNIDYVDLRDHRFLTLFRVEFLYSGGTLSRTLTRLGLNDFFSNSDIRTIYTFPMFYNYNLFSNKLYFYPKPSITGVLNVFGKKKIGKEGQASFESIEDEFPDYVSETFLLYLEYFFAKFLCSGYNAPWQAQKEELLKSYSRLVDSENNISYQELSLFTGASDLPIRNTRIGL